MSERTVYIQSEAPDEAFIRLITSRGFLLFALLLRKLIANIGEPLAPNIQKLYGTLEYP